MEHKVLIKANKNREPVLFNTKNGKTASIYRLADVTGGEVYSHDPVICGYDYEYYHELNGVKEYIFDDLTPEGNGKDYSHYLSVDDPRWDTLDSDYREKYKEYFK